jgi:hypothetical protein
MKTHNILTNEPDKIQNDKADFLLISLSPESVCSFEQMSTRHENLFSPMLITHAINNLIPFSSIEFLNLTTMDIQLNDARAIFAKGMAFGRSYELKGNYLILAQDTKNMEKNALNTLLSLQENNQMSIFEKLSDNCDATLLFCAGFLLEASRRFHVVAGGGIEMELVLLIADLLRGDVLMRLKSENITYATTSWSVHQQNVLEVLKQLSYAPHAIHTGCSLEHSEIEKLKEIGLLTEKDKAGAGAALAYGVAHGLTNEALVSEMELIVYMA